MKDEGGPDLPDSIWPEEDGPAGRAADDEPVDDHDYEPHFDRVRQSVDELAERLDRVIRRCEAVEDPGPRRASVLRRAREIRARLERMSDRTGVMLGVGHMRLETQVQLVEIRLQELEEG